MNYRDMNRQYRFLTYITIGLTIITGLTACTEDRVVLSNGSGFMTLGIECDPTAIAPDGSEIMFFKPTDSQCSVSISDIDGIYSHTWESAADFPQIERYLEGTYDITVSYSSLEVEGIQSPCYKGAARVMVSSGETTRAAVTATLSNVPVRFTPTDAFNSEFPSATLLLHTPGGSYVELTSENQVAFMRPDNIAVYLSIELDNGKGLIINPVSIPAAKARYVYDLTFDYDKDTRVLSVEYNSAETHGHNSILIDEHIADSPSPTIVPVGFVSDSPISVTEGACPQSGIGIDISAPAELSSLTLSIKSPSPSVASLPSETDLLNADSETLAKLSSAGLDIAGITPTGGTVEFNNLISSLVYRPETDNRSVFTIIATDKYGQSSAPVSLVVNTEEAKLDIRSVSRVEVGDPSVTLTIEAENISDQNCYAEISTDNGKNWGKTDILDIALNEDGRYEVTFAIPSGTAPLSLRIVYCGQIRDTISIKRLSPAYSIEVDAFARVARIRIIPNDPELLSMITEYASVFISDNELPIISRDIENGYIMVMGLSPATTYNFRSTIMTEPDDNDFTSPVSVTTEGTPSLPNCDFEETKESLKYDDLPSGGRYSQNSVAIFNRQNFTTYHLSTPVKGWANTNAKTFCKSAANKNTWYMQPSVFSVTDAANGAYGVKLTSVGYDLNGPEIQPYLQESEPYTDYSKNIPEIAHRAAGKLFLGEYSFNPESGEEVYKEGISFNARPLSLNGYYRFIPATNSRDERALIKVEVLGVHNGVETVLADKEYPLAFASGYTAFSVPIDYPVFGAKASAIRVMFSSSAKYGTIEQEDASVALYFDPQTATAIGNQLWIDNITLGY